MVADNTVRFKLTMAIETKSGWCIAILIVVLLVLLLVAILI